METKLLSLTPANSLKAYNSAEPSIKKWMKESYPGFNFDPEITDINISYEAACEIVEITPLTIEHFRFLPVRFQESSFASHQLDIIAQAMNGKDENGNWWEFDYENSNQPKYYPIFYWNVDRAGGPGFSYFVYSYVFSYSFVGARHSFRKSEWAVFAGKHFAELYNTFLKPYRKS